MTQHGQAPALIGANHTQDCNLREDDVRLAGLPDVLLSNLLAVPSLAVVVRLFAVAR